MESLSCEPDPSCRFYETGCGEDRHHVFYPRRDYIHSEPVLKRLREAFVFKTCKGLHQEYHATTEPPEQPNIHQAKMMLENQAEFLQLFTQEIMEAVYVRIR